MVVEGAAAINAHFWSLMGKLWSDFDHERHNGSDRLREYTAKHKIHVCDVSQTVNPKNKPDWQLRSEAASLRRTVETLEAEIRELKRARTTDAQAQLEQLKRERDTQAQARLTAEQALEDLKTAHAAQLRREQEERAKALAALAREESAHGRADAALIAAEVQQARLKTQLEQSETLTLDLKRQLQTLDAHACVLRTELADANRLTEGLEHALAVAAATATSRQRELLEVKQQHRGLREPPAPSARLRKAEGIVRRASEVLAESEGLMKRSFSQCPLFGPRRRRRVEYR